MIIIFDDDGISRGADHIRVSETYQGLGTYYSLNARDVSGGRADLLLAENQLRELAHAIMRHLNAKGIADVR